MRPTCRRCRRPQVSCYCDLISALPCPVEVIILQHPREQHHPKNTGRLLHLCLPSSELRVTARLTETPAAMTEPGNALLYPAQADPPAAVFPANEPLRRLWVIDASWRKSRRMLAESPPLQALPRLNLAATTPTQYRVRGQQRPGQLATLEAAALALEQQAGIDTAALLDAFTRYNDRIAAHLPHLGGTPPQANHRGN